MATDHEAAAADEPTEGAPGRRRRRLPQIPPKLLAFAGVLCAGVLIGWVVFRDDETAPVAPAATDVRVPAAERVYPRLGMTLRLPRGWKASFRRSVLTAVSRDQTVSVAFSAAGGSGQGPRVRRSDRTELVRLFRARELSRNRARVGGSTTIVTELVGRSRNGRAIRILSMGASSRWRTYSIQSFTVPQPTPPRLAELRTLMTSVRFRQPV